MPNLRILRETTWNLPDDPDPVEGYPIGKLVEAELDLPDGGSVRFFVRENYADRGHGRRNQVFELRPYGPASWLQSTFDYVMSAIIATDPLHRPVRLAPNAFSAFAARVAFGDFPPADGRCRGLPTWRSPPISPRRFQ